MDAPPDPAPLVDFDDLRRRVAAVVVPVAALCLLGAVIDGAIRGLTFALLGRWLGVFVLVSVLGIAVFTAFHALGGAGRAGRRGERLSSPDVGIAPRRLSNPLWVQLADQEARRSGDDAASDEHPDDAAR